MRILSRSGAEHFCRSFSGSEKILGIRPMIHKLKGKRVINEGSRLYSMYCDNLLRDVDRSLLLSVSSFERGLELLKGAGAVWALVTFYYSNWFAARAILGLHGACVEMRTWIHVEREKAGSQQFRVERTTKNHPSHKFLWKKYYDGVQRLSPFLEPKSALAVQPINSNPTWQIDTRNRFNYNTLEAVSLVNQFVDNLEPADVLATLPGELNTQFKITKETLLLALLYANQLNLETDAFQPTFAARVDALEGFVFKPEVLSWSNESLGSPAG